MFRVVFESVFDVVYLTFVICMGIYMITKNGDKLQYKLYGIMAVTLGVGDSFHLIPRIFALIADDFEKFAFFLGYGKFITSITMTIFYLVLYYVYTIRYKSLVKKSTSITIGTLAVLRILLCLLPQNQWATLNPPLLYGVIRNIPFAIMGLMIIVLFYKAAKEFKDVKFNSIYISVILSFAFYVPVVLFGHVYPIIGALMIPKTMAYAYIVWILYKAYREEVPTNLVIAY